MNPELGVVSKKRIEALRELSDTEYEEYEKAHARLIRFASDQHLFMIVRLNYDEYENLLKRYFEEYTKDPRMFWSRIEGMVLNINRHIMNYLSAVRTFLDHSETNLKRRYGPNSQRVRRFRDACSSAYDNHFSYRFVSELRNYVQHCGMPLGELTLHSVEVDPHTKKVHHSLAVKFNRDELLSNFRWKSRLTKEIQKLPLRFEITPHLAEMMKCLERINLTLFEDDLPELVQSAEYVQKLISNTKDKPGVPCILRIKDVARTQEGKVKQLKMDIEWIPLHLVEFIMNVRGAH